MGEQAKNKLTKQHMSKENTITNWRGANLRNTDNIGERVKKKIIHSYILEFVPYFYTPISLTRGLKYVTKSAERFKQKSSNCRVLSERKVELEDIKWVSRSHQSQKDRQCNDKKKKDNNMYNHLQELLKKLHIEQNEPHRKSGSNTRATSGKRLCMLRYHAH